MLDLFRVENFIDFIESGWEHQVMQLAKIRSIDEQLISDTHFLRDKGVVP